MNKEIHNGKSNAPPLVRGKPVAGLKLNVESGKYSALNFKQETFDLNTGGRLLLNFRDGPYVSNQFSETQILEVTTNQKLLVELILMKSGSQLPVACCDTWFLNCVNRQHDRLKNLGEPLCLLYVFGGFYQMIDHSGYEKSTRRNWVCYAVNLTKESRVDCTEDGRLQEGFVCWQRRRVISQ